MYADYIAEDFDPYKPITPRRKRRPRSVPPPAPSNLSTSSDVSNRRVWTSSQYIRGISVGPSYQQRAYDTMRRQYIVPQTAPARKSLSNAGNLRPPPSYRHSMARMGHTTGLKQQDPYYYASRDHLARTGSYYGTYGRPTQHRATPSRVSNFYPDHRHDIYSPSYGDRYGHRQPAQSYKPVIVESQDNLGRVSHFMV